jgi:hypothetical protein
MQRYIPDPEIDWNSLYNKRKKYDEERGIDVTDPNYDRIFNSRPQERYETTLKIPRPLYDNEETAETYQYIDQDTANDMVVKNPKIKDLRKIK